MSKEYIDKDKVLELLYSHRQHFTNTRGDTVGVYNSVNIDALAEEINELPAVDGEPVDAVPVKYGHWIDTGSGQECSVCGEIQYGHDSGRYYCQNCGAKMRMKQDVVIKNIYMPSTCDECFALDEGGDYPTCIITQISKGYNFNTRGKRMSECPLVPLDERKE